MRILKVLLLILLLGTVSAFGQTGAPSQATNEFSSLWFVELGRAPLADVDANFSALQRQNYVAQLRADKNAFRNAARAAGVQFQERRAFDVLWNGLSVAINPAQLSTLARVPGVKSLYPVETVSIPQTQPMSQPELASALAMTGADIAQNEMGLDGTGIKVAVMDTGIDYTHPDLGGPGSFPTSRIIAGTDFVGDAFDASNPANQTPNPDDDPMDCNGHGTHVAGIVGASGAVKGVATNVRFGAYKVFGCVGSTFADIMIAAMEQLLADGMHILNMSIGSAFQWPQYPTAQASDRLVNKGVVVVASIGNSGANGLYSSSAPGVGGKVIGVASFDNTHVNLAAFTISPDDVVIGYGNAAAAPPAPLAGTFPMARTGTQTSAADACSALPAGSLSGHVALIRRGTCTFHLKSLNAQNAGALAVVLYNNVAGRFSPTVAGTPPITIPVVAISDTEGNLIDSRLASGPVSMTWTDQAFTAVNPTGGRISGFSSYGLSPDLTVKPDIGAPGGLIRSTWPVAQGSYATISGTSMSAPHVAGSAALLLQAKPNTQAQAVRAILQNSASPRVRVGTPAGLDNVHRQGAGMLQIDKGINPILRIEPSKLSLGEVESGSVTPTITIENNTNDTVTFDLSHVPALATGPNTFTPAFFDAPSTVVFSANPLTLLAKATATINVTITPNAALANRSQFGGYIKLSRTANGVTTSYQIPYSGFKGDYQSIVAITPTPAGFPWLARLVGTSFTNQPAGATYTMTGGDIPWILVHLDHQVRRLRMEVFDANTGRAWHRAFEAQYVGRNSTATSFFALPWDGRTTSGNRVVTVPDGQFVIKLSIQKALGDDNNTAHWESWTSPVITIDRP